MAKKIYVSEDGYASCPACLNHIRLDEQRDETVCPFCDEQLRVAAAAPSEGERSLDVLRSSRSGLIASALMGAGLSMTVACADPDPSDDGDNDFNVSEDVGDVDYEDTGGGHDPVQDYGDFPNDYEDNLDEPRDAGMEDAGDEEDDDDDEEEPEEENQEDG